uniref:Uncharacterized protein n=1 Tax=Helicotheca tamesis TaxID=374047 RepID=A0A7S2E227_9STRA|mmetsp:Transcript_11877/g.16414  ORF Transcript_11877/g.16414 Transcript_11877/m.16414 type:complete len:104 (+) Transcript_11877:69-380(+)|eukprot:CAMPEP_0185723764 /NCGR_PEP_ID=MMETSP1171-20130828/497_1 /TAXON_ID=374046 /ORGANISM="Helicotheca tamensis, Strain CCMP826" /LENGTH=103 /DNA_ID=CAMNT_0028391517 /DNA_START=45 /DNA_END=356 /DNA_ORIENTATION=+
MATETKSLSLNPEAAVLKKRWSNQLQKAGVSEDAVDSPKLQKKMSLQGNAWADCAEVEELHKACSSNLPGLGLKQDSAICKAAGRYFDLCMVHDELGNQDGTY